MKEDSKEASSEDQLNKSNPIEPSRDFSEENPQKISPEPTKTKEIKGNSKDSNLKKEDTAKSAEAPKRSFFKKSKDKDEKSKKVPHNVERIESWHDKHYKLLFLIPIFLLVFCSIYIVIFYHNTGDLMRKDITLTGGTSITLYENNVSSATLANALSGKLPNLDVTSIYDFGTNMQKAVVLDTTGNWSTAQKELQDYLGYNLTEGKNVDVEFTGSTLGNSFYNQILIAILIAFVFMSIVIFILFRTFVPSMAVILSAFADIFMALVTVDIFGIKVSTAGIVAFLMLIGYSVDTDILLTTRMLRRTEGTLDQRLFSAFKTGMTMTLTSIFSIGFALIIVESFSTVLAQIFEIIVIGLFFDLLNTWITNVAILKLYVEHKAKKGEVAR